MKRLFFLFLLTIITNLTIMAQFSAEEKNIINSAAADIPLRVLLTTNDEDSLFLRKQCADVDDVLSNQDLQLLIERMKATMVDKSGVGIAAPQVGVAKNVFLFLRVDQQDWPVAVAINPKIVNRPEETICFEGDGCLSVPDRSGNSIRYPWVEVEYTNEKGELVHERLEGYSREGNFVSIIFQHEYDHLQGVLYIDKLYKE